MKWVRRLFSYALKELEIIETHPMYDFSMQTPEGREFVWAQWEVDRVIEAALMSHKSRQGNISPLAHPSPWQRRLHLVPAYPSKTFWP